ncbi:MULTISPECIES: alpha/beta fold hydrolase [Alteromonas]|jgi:2-hydroxymuconate-semialdehyde hydrolase|uniref:alpha/beta fold hydrolase n=1 Tax=Alteromonas TaxID=226 RepID=UPI001286513B|nr:MULTISPECIES: alpha/beta hydrolase [Alteromonas]MBT0588143.1 alpha/beta fold hydrolase [Alteromonas oceanisediminis]CAI3970782.1 2-hydroxymuconate semialdehyde hydrolase [Alteromonas macleodii]VTP58264.1 2-hydroxymuconate semialdehyde hydrolase [Alteromonas macleodii]
MTASEKSPEIGREITAAGYRTNVHDHGGDNGKSDVPVMMIHGSGPGVTAWANWRLVIPELAKHRRVVAPDMLGFGYTERPGDNTYNRERWVAHAIGVMDSLDLEKVDLIGNSFGGGLALALAIEHPERVRRLVLMGSVGVSFPITKGLDEVWGYQPSLETMRRLMDVFAFNKGLLTDELAEMRYQASIRPGFQESFAAMFPAPRQRWVDNLASREEDIRALPHETLLLHGREDEVIPLEASLKLAELIDRAQLHVFGRCGHWTQIEHAGRFARLVNDFFDEADKAASGDA